MSVHLACSLGIFVAISFAVLRMSLVIAGLLGITRLWMERARFEPITKRNHPGPILKVWIVPKNV